MHAHPHRRSAALLAMALVLGLTGLSACGSSGGDDSGKADSTPTSTTSASSTTAAPTTTTAPATTTTAAGGRGGGDGSASSTGEITTANICSLATLDQVATILPNPEKGATYPPSVVTEGARCDWEQTGTKAFAGLEADRPGAALAGAVVQGQIASGVFKAYAGVGDSAGWFVNQAGDGGAIVAAKGDVVLALVLTNAPAPVKPEPLAALANELLDQLAG